MPLFLEGPKMKNVTKTSGNTSVTRKLLLSTTALLAAGQVMTAGKANAVDDYADWDGVTIVEGQATVNDTGLGSTTIDQSTMRAVGEATELHIGTMGDVKINQTSGDSLFVGRVIGNHSDPTQILGKLSADGRVMIIDRNGVLFGQNSQVDVAGIAVTTGDVSNADIMDGDENFTFSNFGDGEIVLEGTMNIKDAGLAAFVAPNVRNSGVINAKMGKVVFASGETVTIDLYGDGLLEVAIDGELGDALLENKGTINAEGGSVIMTAQSAKNVVDNVINNEGIIKVTSVEQKGGKIILSGGNNGKVSNTGTLDASGKQGGSVEVTGQAIELGADSEIKANATDGEAGDIEVIADETLLVDGKIEARGESGTGFIETSAPDVDFGADTEIASTGKWLLDPTSIVIDSTLGGFIEGQLAVGDFEVETPAGGTEQGAITFTTVVDWSTASTFTATAIGDIRFNGNSGLNATGAGNVVLNAGDDIRMYDAAFGIHTIGGNVTLNAGEEVTMRDGGIFANGGDILINNADGGFYGFENSLNTSGTGTITLNQFEDTLENNLGTATIQNAIDAINNTGNGMNTINVGEGTYDEELFVDVNNIALLGTPGDLTVPGANSATLQGDGTDDSVAITVAGGLNDVTISGFEIDNFDDGINALSGGGSLNINNNTINAVDAGIRAFSWDSVDIGYNTLVVSNAFEIDPGAIFLSATESNIHDNIMSDVGDVGLFGVSIFGSGTHTIVRNDISGFGTGVNLSSGVTADIRNNFINDNDTGISGFGGNVTVSENDLSGNTIAVDNLGGNVLDASANWFGTTDEASVIAMTSGDVDVSPYLADGTDADTGTLGFQGDFSTLYVTDDGAQDSGLINEAVALVDEDGTILVNDGLYTENVTIDKSLKLTGLADATLQAESAGEALITVTADDVNIDPFVFDGLRLVNYGIVANGMGTHGLVVDGNTFRNFKKGGVFIGYSNGADVEIKNNTFEGTMGHGVRTGTLNGNSVVRITDNTFGSDADPLNYVGIDIGVLRNSDVFISGNNLVAQELGINFEYLGNGSYAEVADNSIEGIDGNGIKFLGIENSTVLISSNDKIVSENGTGISVDSGKFNDKILNNATITIDGNVEIAGYDGYGIDFFEGDLAGDSVINITNNEYIHGYFDGIYVGDDVFGGVSVNISGNGVGAIIDDEYVVYSGISTDVGNGIALYGVETSDIRNNVIDGVGTDGIHLEDFGQTWIAYNYIYNTGDDGIEAIYGDFASVYGNTIENIGMGFGGGFPPTLLAEGPASIMEFYDEFGADGIHLRNVGGIEILPPSAEEGEDGFGYGSYGADSEIFENDISIVADDGIEVINGNVNYIGNNVIGHVNGNGISVEGTYVTEINGNVVTLAADNGIHVNGFFFAEDYDDEMEFIQLDDDFEEEYPYGVYAGIFNNKILLTGSDGIEVYNVGGEVFFPGDVVLLGAEGYGDYGWSVNIQGNEVAMTGDNGILSYSNNSVRIHENSVFMAGMGSELEGLIEMVNGFAAGVPPLFALQQPQQLVEEWEGDHDGEYFGWNWGDGHGIAVYETFGYGPEGDSVDVQYNTVMATGGHGITVEGAPNATISYNDVSYNGLNYTEFEGFSSLSELISSGPFDDHSGYFDEDEGETEVESVVFLDSETDSEYGADGYPSRRDLWLSADQSLTEILKEYVPSPSYITYDSHDGINVAGVGGELIFRPKVASISGSGLGYPYDLDYSLKIQGNTIDHTGDDGIEVLYSGRTLIGGYGEEEGNTITNVGFGISGGSYGPDYKGADGIHVAEVYTYGGLTPMTAGVSGDDPETGYYGYAVDIIGNTIDSVQDDGIEVIVSESTLIDGNTISNVGLGDDYSGRDYDGSDGIFVGGVGTELLWKATSEAGIVGEGSGTEIDPYSVVIIGNTIDNTQDDGIEVVESGRTRIGGFADGEGNTITNVGTSYYLGDYGADGIHVRYVYTDPYILYGSGSVTDSPADHFYDVQVINNTVTGTQDDGVEVLYSGDTLIQGNTLTDIGFSGPIIAMTSAEAIYFDDYEYDGADGIHVVSEGGFGPVGLLDGPQFADDDYYYGYGSKVAIIDNTITNATDDGIHTEGVNELLVDINTVEGAMDDGIRIIGYGGYGDVVSPETELSVALAPQGIVSEGYYNAVISDNVVTGSGSDGIQTSGYDETEITGNTVVNSTENGVYVSGFFNGNVLFQGNTLVNNGGYETFEGEEFLIGAGARFESGNIDFSDLTNPNIFVNTTGEKAVAMQFDPAMMEDIYYYDKIARVAIDEIVPMDPILANLTIVNETLGSTIFTGYQPEGSFYVRFEDGAILDELGNVIVIDGLNASFEGLVPADQGGTLPATSIEFIEERLWDADDPLEDGRGQIFIGVAQDGLDNIQDFFNEFEGAGPEASGLNVTFLGLPNVNQPAPQNVEPAAGEGAEGSDVANIEPAAGEGEGESEQVNCWSELTNTLQTGKSASIADDGTDQSVMNQTANCGAQQS